MSFIDKGHPPGLQSISICDEFGVSPNVADNSGAINQALSSLGPLGLRSIIDKPGIYPFSNPIVIGNGSGSAQSTWTSELEGVGMPGWLDGTYQPTQRVTLKWTGAAGATMIVVQGGVSGWALRRLFLDGNSVTSAARPLVVNGGMFGEIDQFYTKNTYDGILVQPPSGSGTGVRNAMHNRLRWMGVNILGYPNGQSSATNSCIMLDNNGQAGANACFNQIEQFWFNLPATSVGNVLSGIYLRGCDSNSFRYVHPLYTTGGTDTQFPVSYDYSGTNSGWPEGNGIENVDLQKQPRNVGVPTGTPGNWIGGISPANGGYPTNPALTGLQWGYSATV